MDKSIDAISWPLQRSLGHMPWPLTGARPSASHEAIPPVLRRSARSKPAAMCQSLVSIITSSYSGKKYVHSSIRRRLGGKGKKYLSTHLFAVFFIRRVGKDSWLVSKRYIETATAGPHCGQKCSEQYTPLRTPCKFFNSTARLTIASPSSRFCSGDTISASRG